MFPDPTTADMLSLFLAGASPPSPPPMDLSTKKHGKTTVAQDYCRIQNQ